MAGFLNDIQQAVGEALDEVHNAAGVAYTYTLVTDEATMTTSDLSIYMWPTELVEVDGQVGGMSLETLSDAGNLSAEAMPVFRASREAFNISGTYYRPTLADSFVAAGTTEPVHFVKQVTSILGLAAGYRISATAVFGIHGRT